MSRIFSVNSEELSLILFLMYKSCHLNSFRMTDSNKFEEYLDNVIAGRESNSKYHINGSESDKIKKAIIINLVDYKSQESVVNPWLKTITNPRIGCINNSVQDSSSVTISELLRLTKSVENNTGTCRTCYRDCNTFEQKTASINLVHSNAFFVPNCRLKMTSIVDFSGFVISLTKPLESDRYIVESLKTTKTTKIIFFNLLKKVKGYEDIANYLKSKHEQVKFNKKTLKVKLTLGDSSRFSKGAFAELLSRGYHPKFSIILDDDNGKTSGELLINNVIEMKDLISFTCNPMLFENTLDLFKSDLPIFDLDDVQNTNSSTWELLYCLANSHSLDRLEQELTEASGARLSSTLFKETNDESLANLEFEYYIDTIRFWMC